MSFLKDWRQINQIWQLSGSALSRGILAVGGVSGYLISRPSLPLPCWVTENLPLSVCGTRHSPTQMLLENDQDQILVGSLIGTDVPPTPRAGPTSQALNPAGASLLT